MMRVRTICLAVLICAGILWLSGGENAIAQTVSQAYTKPQPVPLFILENLQGKRVDMGNQKGQVVLLNFWSSWCPICKKEGPSLEKFYNQYQSQGLVFYRITPREKGETVRKFLEKESLHFPVLLDPSGQVERIFGVWLHPTSYLIDRKGMVRYRVMGPWDWNNVQVTSLIDQLLKEE